MQIAIVGLAASGKTTVFNTLTRGHAETGGYGALTLNVGVVKVPDARLDTLAEIFKPKKVVHADVTYADLPAPPPSTEGHVGTEELPAEHLARLRESDALLHVVRAFDDPSVPHPEGSVDPARDLERLDLEFILADLSMVDRRLERLATGGRHGTPAERESNEREEAVLRRLKVELEAGRPIRDAGLPDDEAKAVRGFRFLTEKPVLVLLNVGEADLTAAPALVERIAGAYAHQHSIVEHLSAKIEMELGELEADDATTFMAELGIAESGLERVIRLSYRLLGLDLVPDRGAGRGPRLADPRRIERGRRGRAPSTPISRRASSAPRPWHTTTSSRSAPPRRRARPASFAPRGRPTASPMATSSRSCSAAEGSAAFESGGR